MAVISALSGQIPGYVAGIPIWISAFLFLPTIKPKQRKQSAILFGVGLIGLVFGQIESLNIGLIFRAIDANQKVVVMLLGVGFLRLFASDMKTDKPLPTGRRALLRTLLGAHLFGAVLNMSSVVIIGDRLTLQKQMSPLQGLLLLRAFCICAFWSPFFAAMGLTLIVSPGAQLSTLVLYGLPTSLAAIAISLWEILKQPIAKDMQGYPMAISALWMPCLLAAIVISIHEFDHSLSVLTIVTLTSLIFITLWMLVTQGVTTGLSRLKQHVETGITSSAGEVVLFASAAILAAGVASVIASLHLNLAPAHFGPLQATMTVIILVLLALTGMHPVTSVALAGSILAPTVDDPNLLGLTLLMSWSMGIGLSPFSGIQLSIQSRYDISAKTLLALNWRYGLVMLPLCAASLWFYASYHLAR